jgi:hypothetical protein
VGSVKTLRPRREAILEQLPVEVVLDVDLVSQVPSDQLSAVLNGLLRAALEPQPQGASPEDLERMAAERAQAEAEEAAESQKWDTYLATRE